MTDNSTSVLIVGGGFSGTLTAIHLLRATAGQAATITLIDPASAPGRGLAYRGNDDNLLLNVPAGNMSAFADEPSHFAEFCQQIDPSINVGSFVSRRLYGRYLQLNLQRAMSAAAERLSFVQDQVCALQSQPSQAGFTAQLTSGRYLTAQHVVLALGHQVPGFPLPLPPKEFKKVIEPWDFQHMSQLPEDAPILILGTGHTAVDALFQLTQQGQHRRIWMLSRHGLLPHAHRLNPVPPPASQYPAYLDETPLRVRTLLRELRKEIARKALAGCDWRDALNQLRPHTPRLWQAMPLIERQRFLRHGMAFWDIHRHRLAPLSADRLQALQESDDVRVLGGRLTDVRATSHGMLQVQFRPRCQPREQSLEVAAIINCTGPRMSIGSHSSPLLQQLARDGLLVPDSNSLGVLIDDHYQPTCSSGQATPGLWYVGPMLKAKHWEAIAVPELRGHTQRLAQHLARQLAIYPALPTQAELV